MTTNNTPDPDVAAWMESIGFRYVPNRFDHGKHFVNDDMGGEIDEYQAAFFYHAQQRAVLEGKIAAHRIYANVQDESEATHFEPCNFCGQVSHHCNCSEALIGIEGIAKRNIAELKAELQELEEDV